MLLGGAEGVVPTRFVALNLSALLFLLKIVGVRWLEFGTDGRSLLVLGLAIGLVHAGIWNDGGQFPLFVESHQCIAGLCFAASLTRVQQFGRRLLESNRWRGRRRAMDLVHCLVATNTYDPVAHGPRAPRAPPSA